MVEDTLQRAGIGDIALPHVDCDLHDPVKPVLAKLCPQIVQGGHVAVDDHGSCEGCRLATDEFLAGLEEDIVPAAAGLHVVFFHKPASGGRWPHMPPIPDPGTFARP